jgi:hypothetical protein
VRQQYTSETDRSFLVTEPRSAQEELGGVKLLARVIDKGRAALSGTLGRYCFFDCAPEVSDEEFLAFAEAADADNAAVRWLLHEKSTPPSVLAAINDAVDRLPAETFVDWI